MTTNVVAILESTGRIGRGVALALRRAGFELRVVGRGREASTPWRFLRAPFVSLDAPRDVQWARLRRTGAAFVGPPNARALGDASAAERHAESVFKLIDGVGSFERVVVLSGIGAHPNPAHCGTLVEAAAILESRLSWLLVPTTLVRAPWFVEHWQLPYRIARQTGVLPAVVADVTRALPMVAIGDVTTIVARLLAGRMPSRDVIELEGVRRASAEDVASVLSSTLGRRVRARAIAESQVHRFLESRVDSPHRWMATLRAFSGGELEFEDPSSTVRCPTTLEETIGAWGCAWHTTCSASQQEDER